MEAVMQARLVSQTPRNVMRPDSVVHQPTPSASVAAPAINTILAVREHAPAEIEELSVLIQTLHHRLGVAYARKHLLEKLLTVIHEADGATVSTSGLAVMR
jgi:hypothetical protein